MEKLRPLVRGQTQKYATKIRYGRGFTLQELRTAGLTPAFARSVGISVDHRRHNLCVESLQSNVARLEQYKNRLILFPNKADKYKKGEIADSTAGKLQSAEAKQQNTEQHLLEKKAPKLREKPVKITSDMQNVKVFRRIRQERVNERYAGRREKRAAEEAENNAKKKK